MTPPPPVCAGRGPARGSAKKRPKPMGSALCHMAGGVEGGLAGGLVSREVAAVIPACRSGRSGLRCASCPVCRLHRPIRASERCSRGDCGVCAPR